MFGPQFPLTQLLLSVDPCFLIMMVWDSQTCPAYMKLSEILQCFKVFLKILGKVHEKYFSKF